MWIELDKNRKYPWYVRALLKSQNKRYGQAFFPTLYWGTMPPLFALFTGFFKFFERKRSTLDPSLRSLVMVYVAQLNWCKFCIDLNALLLAEKTGSMEKFEGLKNGVDQDLYSDAEKAALKYAELVTKSELPISTELQLRLKDSFSGDELIELTALISYQNMSAKFNAALDIPSQGLCEIPQGPK